MVDLAERTRVSEEVWDLAVFGAEEKMWSLFWLSRVNPPFERDDRFTVLVPWCFHMPRAPNK